MEATLNGNILRAGAFALAAALTVTVTPELLPTAAPQNETSDAGARRQGSVTELLSLRTQPAAAQRSTRAKSARAAVPVKRTVSAAYRRAVLLNHRRDTVVRFARAQKGKWYSYGATGMKNFDCSGLTQRSMRAAGVKIPRTSRGQRGAGIRVASRNARIGDLVSYNGHVGILVGKWRMVDAPGTGRRVIERRVYKTGDLQFRRVIR